MPKPGMPPEVTIREIVGVEAQVARFYHDNADEAYAELVRFERLATDLSFIFDVDLEKRGNPPVDPQLIAQYNFRPYRIVYDRPLHLAASRTVFEAGLSTTASGHFLVHPDLINETTGIVQACYGGERGRQRQYEVAITAGQLAIMTSVADCPLAQNN